MSVRVSMGVRVNNPTEVLRVLCAFDSGSRRVANPSGPQEGQSRGEARVAHLQRDFGEENPGSGLDLG